MKEQCNGYNLVIFPPEEYASIPLIPEVNNDNQMKRYLIIIRVRDLHNLDEN